MDWIYPVIGLVIGMVVGLTGVGGGSLMTPLLVLGFGIPPATAVGTDLLYAAITKAGGAITHGLQRTVDWCLVRRLAAGSIPAALVTVTGLHLLAIDGRQYSTLITVVLGVALMLTALALMFRERLRRLGAARAGDAWIERHALFVTVIAGALLGVLVSISSVGAGALGVPALLFLYPKRPLVKIIGADIAHAVPLTLIGGLGHAAVGTVDYPLLASLLVGSVPGIWIGSRLSVRLPETALRPALAVLLIVIGGRLVF
jgi:uncharacterized membrane protein YfcA